MLPVNQIIVGSALEVLGTFPAGLINCCISSPPYWSLRDYGIDGQLGLEPTFEEYIDKLCTVYDEVFRVLRKDGTCWVNLGDTYSSTPAGNKIYETQETTHCSDGSLKVFCPKPQCNIATKSLCLIPQRFAIEMVNRGWILRNVLIWHKPNPMPSSAKDRFTVDFEYVFFFVKSKRYWFEPQYEPFLTESNAERPRMGQGQNTQYQQKRKEVKPVGIIGEHSKRGQTAGPLTGDNPLGRNKRCVWTIPTQACPEAHFATFPEKLVEPMIKAGCPEFVCKKCGKAREKVYNIKWGEGKGKNYNAGRPDGMVFEGRDRPSEHIFKGYTDCGCNAGWRAGVMCDPFVVQLPLQRWRLN